MGCSLGAASLVVAPAMAADTDSPLNRLQLRSGDERWQELKSRTPAAAAPMPAALSPKAPGSSLIDAARSAPAPETKPAAPVVSDIPLPPSFEPAAPTETVATPIIDEGAFEEPALPFEPNPLSEMPLESLLNQEPAPRAMPLQPELGESELPVVSLQDQLLQAPPVARTFALRPITDIQPFFDYAPDSENPCEHLCPLPDGLCPPDPNSLCPEPLEMPMAGSPERYFPHLEYYWSASNLYHNPLYFENPALERYGHVHFNDCVEPAYSMARFGAQLVGLPYQMALDHACRRQYALGWYRPGDFAPKLIYQPPLNARAAGTAAAAYTGLILLVP